MSASSDKLGGPFTPPGFYYKTFIRPRRFWPLYEKLLRNAAGLGDRRPEQHREDRVDVEHRHATCSWSAAAEQGSKPPSRRRTEESTSLSSTRAPSRAAACSRA